MSAQPTCQTCDKPKCDRISPIKNEDENDQHHLDYFCHAHPPREGREDGERCDDSKPLFSISHHEAGLHGFCDESMPCRDKEAAKCASCDRPATYDPSRYQGGYFCENEKCPAYQEIAPADEGEKCRLNGDCLCHPRRLDGTVIAWLCCLSCSPRPEAGKEGKCGECGKQKCACTSDANYHDKYDGLDAGVCHGHPSVPDLKRDLDAIKGTPEGDALGRAIASTDADAGGWRGWNGDGDTDKYQSDAKPVEELYSGVKNALTPAEVRELCRQHLNREALTTRSSLIDEAIAEVALDALKKPQYSPTRAIAALNELRKRV